MLVDGTLREPVLVALEALPEVVLLHESAAHEQIEGAVDRRLPDPVAATAELMVDVVDRQVRVRVEDNARDGLSLLRHGETLAVQVATEEPDERFLRRPRIHDREVPRKAMSNSSTTSSKRRTEPGPARKNR